MTEDGQMHADQKRQRNRFTIWISAVVTVSALMFPAPAMSDDVVWLCSPEDCN